MNVNSDENLVVLMLYRALLILLLSVMAINPAISAAVPVVAAHSQMDCHGDHCGMSNADMTGSDVSDSGMNSSDCCDAELPDCCLQLSAVLFMMPTGFHLLSSSPVPTGWAPSAYLSAIPPPLYHPPRTISLSV
ncbi:hypothetical protein [uncultured Amphritea sp.]|uniref:hypothetical protein n=1 Tax=uncultured Amphritea sp. TaxID=981605 RepID=UPI002607E295|nr:hypothetical protein [uncultured Amphritea sp.]